LRWVAHMTLHPTLAATLVLIASFTSSLAMAQSADSAKAPTVGDTSAQVDAGKAPHPVISFIRQILNGPPPPPGSAITPDWAIPEPKVAVGHVQKSTLIWAWDGVYGAARDAFQGMSKFSPPAEFGVSGTRAFNVPLR
jgi:hypothetical protein